MQALQKQAPLSSRSSNSTDEGREKDAQIESLKKELEERRLAERESREKSAERERVKKLEEIHRLQGRGPSARGVQERVGEFQAEFPNSRGEEARGRGAMDWSDSGGFRGPFDGCGVGDDGFGSSGGRSMGGGGRKKEVESGHVH